MSEKQEIELLLEQTNQQLKLLTDSAGDDGIAAIGPAGAELPALGHALDLYEEFKAYSLSNLRYEDYNKTAMGLLMPTRRYQQIRPAFPAGMASAAEELEHNPSAWLLLGPHLRCSYCLDCESGGILFLWEKQYPLENVTGIIVAGEMRPCKGGIESRVPAQLVNGRLNFPHEQGTRNLRPNTWAWWQWLERGESFYFHDDSAGRGSVALSGNYWRMTRRMRDGSIERAYLGASDRLTLRRLRSKARELTVSYLLSVYDVAFSDLAKYWIWVLEERVSKLGGGDP